MNEEVHLKLDWLINALITLGGQGYTYIEKKVMDKFYEDYGMKIQIQGTGMPMKGEM